jgi:hypothetical protein
MKRLAMAITSGLFLLTLATPALAATTTTFSAVIHEDFGRRASSQPCFAVGDDFACPGSGTVQGYARVTSVILFPSDGSPLVRTLTFGDGSTLITNETPISFTRLPGKAYLAPGAAVGYGNPGFDHYAWVIVGGTGQFAGATGSGEWVNVLAGDTIVIKFSGVLTLP